MKILVTGSSGHLGEALVRTFRDDGNEVIGLDVKESAFTTMVGSVADRSSVKECMSGVDTVYHAATLHKPHVATHSMQEFVDTNVSGTLALLEQAKANGVRAFVFTSTTSVFGDALRPPAGTPAAWVTEDVKPIPKNIYGVTKTAAEDLQGLNSNAPAIVRKRAPGYQEIYNQFGWKMFDKINRVYVNDAARADLGWRPKYDFAHILKCLQKGNYPRSPIAESVGSKGYHKQTFTDGPYPV